MKIARPTIPASTYTAMALTSDHPNCATAPATSAKMPTGATSSTHRTMRISAWVATSASWVRTSRLSSGSAAAATAKIVMNTISGSRVPSTAARSGFAGTRSTMKRAPDGACSPAWRWKARAAGAASPRPRARARGRPRGRSPSTRGFSWGARYNSRQLHLPRKAVSRPLITLAAVRRALRGHWGTPAVAPDARPAAVALVVIEGADGAEVLLIRRAVRAGDPWSGQVALPGGRREPTDRDLLATAIRETREDTGIVLLRGEPLAGLDVLATVTAVLPPVVVRPFVFALSRRPAPSTSPRDARPS